jgi:hypothetical protein
MPHQIMIEAEAQVPEELSDFFAEGCISALRAKADCKPFNPDLSEFVNNAQKQAFVKGYTAFLQQESAKLAKAAQKLEAAWYYEQHPNQQKFVEFLKRRSEGIPSDFRIHFDRGFNMTCYDKNHEYFFTDEQQADFLTEMVEAFCKGAAAGYEAQCPEFKGANLIQLNEY